MSLKKKMYIASLVSFAASISAYITSRIYAVQLSGTLKYVLFYVFAYGLIAGFVTIAAAFIMKSDDGKPFYIMPKTLWGRLAFFSGLAALLSFGGICWFFYNTVVCGIAALICFAGLALSAVSSVFAFKTERSMLLLLTQIFDFIFIFLGLVMAA